MNVASLEGRRRALRAVACAAVVGISGFGFSGCGQAEPGNPKDFEGKLDTSQAESSESAKAFPAGKVDDGSGSTVKPPR